ncbi:MAG: alpha/beta hydrolase [Pseudomonadota bacterium]
MGATPSPVDRLAAFHAGFTGADYDAQYDLLARRPEFVRIAADWQTRSAAVFDAAEREGRRHRVRYGEAPRAEIDILIPAHRARRPSRAGCPVILYFHGGYWQRGAREMYAFLAPAFLEAGIAFALAGYSLCPDASIPQILEEAGAAVACMRREAAGIGIAGDALTVMGHSAGGQIALMLASHGPGKLPATARAIAVSPVTWLDPVRHTPALHAPLAIDDDTIARCSPQLFRLGDGAEALVLVGADETDAFRLLANTYAETQTALGGAAQCREVPDVDHFDILEVIANGASPTFKMIRSFAATD